VNQLEQQEALGREAQKSQVENQSHRINADTEGSVENKQSAAFSQSLDQSSGNVP